VHISEMSRDKVSNMNDVVAEGQEMEFECLQDGASGKMSRRMLLGEVGNHNGSDATASASSEAAESTPRAGHHHTRRSASQRRPKTARRARTQSK
jgi:predicted RNA-binding protein with RPS1 domain